MLWPEMLPFMLFDGVEMDQLAKMPVGYIGVMI